MQVLQAMLFFRYTKLLAVEVGYHAQTSHEVLLGPLLVELKFRSVYIQSTKSVNRKCRTKS